MLNFYQGCVSLIDLNQYIILLKQKFGLNISSKWSNVAPRIPLSTHREYR